MNEKTLTAEQCSKLSLYILMTTKTREGEAATWEKLAEEKKEDGSPKYIHWWMEDGVLPGQMEFDDLLSEEDEEW